MFMQPTPQRRFLELTMVGTEKKLYMPADAVLTYEFVPEGKNPNFPETGTFLRYDFGEGLSFAIVRESLEQLKEEVGTDGFIQLHLLDDAELYIKSQLFIAAQEKEDEGIQATQISLNLNGQVGSVFVKEKFEEIKPKLAS